MKKFICIMLATAALAFAATEAGAQMGKRDYVNAGWQFNGIVGNSFVSSAQGYGAYIEGGYYLMPEFAVGGFASFSTNNEYFPTETYTFDDGSALTTDLDRSVYQVPFGAAFRYRIFRDIVQPYVAARVGAVYSTQNTYMSTFVSRHDNWGFCISPEIGMTLYPFHKTDMGFQVAAYYSYSTNRNKSYDMNGINNLGFKFGIAF